MLPALQKNTETVPLGPPGIVAVACEGLLTVHDGETIPLKRLPMSSWHPPPHWGLFKLLPVIVTIVPAGPLLGEIDAG